ncbi:MAG: DUF438 domain-containing protein [Bacteroidales bacterium]|nr:DUF438 domain-containing protein [Bacteroidales bacterium]
MSELINNSDNRKATLKQLILRLHAGESEEELRKELMSSLQSIPYGEVVEVEQELISEGLPETEVLRLCDAHSAVLQGNVDMSGSKGIPEGHPVDVFREENRALRLLTAQTRELLAEIERLQSEVVGAEIYKLRGFFNQLFDVDKHYQRKEYLLFPYLEREGITGPPKVMWGKHDEIREQIKGAIELLQTENISPADLTAAADIVLIPALFGVEDMIIKEEEFLFPMSLDKLTDIDWYEIAKQSIEIGFCLYDPQVDWKPDWLPKQSINEAQKTGGHVQMPSGSFSVEELLAILNTIPVDMTFVDKDDKVKYFTQGSERIFTRNRSILNRDVRLCHPPASAHIVDKIIDDFKSGKQSRAPFWINKGGKFVHIEYFALRNEQGDYLGTLEVSQDLTHYRALDGEQRILSYK